MAVPNMIKVNYTLTVYKNTGFNGFDIPADPSVLELCDKVQYNDSYYLREDFDKPVINVNDNYHNLSDADYVKLHANQSINNQPVDLYYFCSPSPLANGTTSLSLSIDALLTLGGAKNLEYTAGIQTRGHIPKEEDVLFANVASEAWTPRQMLETPNYREINDVFSGGYYLKDFNILLSTTNILLSGATADEIEVIKGVVQEGMGEDPVMYIPKIKSNSTTPAVKTVFTQRPNNESMNMSIEGVVAFDATNDDVKKGIEKLFSCGQLQLQNSYVIPAQFIESANENIQGLYLSLVGKSGQTVISDMPFEYDTNEYTVKNKKCFSTYRTYTLCNIASGASISKTVCELKKSGAIGPTIRMWVDPSSTGKPFARFITDISPDVPFIDTIEGSQWCNSQIVLEGASGSLLNSLNASFAQQEISRNNRYNEMQKNTELGVANRNIDIFNRNAGLTTYQNRYNILRNAMNMPKLFDINPSVGVGIDSKGSGYMGLGASITPRDKLQDLNNTITSIWEAHNFAMNSADQLANMEANKDLMLSGHDIRTQQLQQAMNESKIGEMINNNVVAPTEIFTPTPNLALYGANKFYLYETRKSIDDLKDEDMYYQMFGYNGLNKKLTKDCFKAREYYNFVQAYNINLKSNKSTSMRLKLTAINQLNSGVRVWNVLPDASYYEIN